MRLEPIDFSSNELSVSEKFVRKQDELIKAGRSEGDAYRACIAAFAPDINDVEKYLRSLRTKDKQVVNDDFGKVWQRRVATARSVDDVKHVQCVFICLFSFIMYSYSFILS